MNISPIKTQRDCRNVLKEIEGLMSAKRNTPEGDRFDVLVTLVEAWERKHYPMDLLDPDHNRHRRELRILRGPADP
jgi:HTH-type transcriptional regulator/antitoxin HigA